MSVGLVGANPREYEGFMARDRVADANVKAAESHIKINEANIHRLETLTPAK